jgi:hypothetical protein
VKRGRRSASYLHALLWHVVLTPQLFPQVPQLVESVLVSTQAVPETPNTLTAPAPCNGNSRKIYEVGGS